MGHKIITWTVTINYRRTTSKDLQIKVRPPFEWFVWHSLTPSPLLRTGVHQLVPNNHKYKRHLNHTKGMWIILQIYRPFNGTGRVTRGNWRRMWRWRYKGIISLLGPLSFTAMLLGNYLKYDHSPYLLLLCNAMSSEYLPLTLGGPKSAVKLCSRRIINF